MEKGSFGALNPKRRQWKSADLIKAIAAVKNGKMGYLKAAKTFQVPKGTVERHAKMDESQSNAILSKRLGRPPVLSEELENKLVQYALTMESKFYRLTRRDLEYMAHQLAEANNVPNPFRDQKAGKNWFYGFMRRHSDKLSLRKPTGTSFARAYDFTRLNVETFYDNLENVYEKHRFTPDRILNVDETEIAIVQTKTPKILTLKDKRQIGALTVPERGKLMTVVIAMTAAGQFVPPLMIFPHKLMNPQLMRGAPAGAIGAVHPSGWIQTNLFTQWFKHMINTLQPSAESPLLVVMDGHNSHTRNVDVIELALKHHVVILTIPPHSSHKLQPLDKTFIGALKANYSEEIRLWNRRHTRPLAVFDVAELFNNAYVKVQRASVAINGFRETGIYPFNRHIFTDADFIEEVNQVGETDFHQQLIVSVQQETDGETVKPEVIESKEMENPPPLPSSSMIVTQDYPDQLVADAEQKKISDVKVSAKRGRKRKSSGDEVARTLTTSRRRGRGHPRSTSSDKRMETSDLSDLEETEELKKHPDPRDECLFCEAMYEDQIKEPWVQCISCFSWAHSGCVGEISYKWVCDYCKN
ncbi:uncharacterized protein LOC117178270 [Belonocnema kinseyi]|uniref:uncharacterized protein LOC117178270 n=1 Tax=Belonocnema kinseyi TaxID=2817044 RepID=UPI00143DA73E|nr:uncharacterized protein LOC117178270 [Belonocnema kinseyi]XP_033225516.1 uncharacterized protein LOC117178270 [Belonocnema kinseyi]